MSLSVPVWYQQRWAKRVIVRYQNRGYVLQGTTMPPVRIEAEKFWFLRTGQMEAQPFTKGDAISPLNPEDDKVEI